jgi:deazaflavin-dependent oxidoreductase (nitroreductase family)
VPEARSLEVEFFRMLNRVVEPIVRRGVGSPRLAPSGFIVLETVGRRSGQARRSPLAATRIGRHMIVATFRGDRSQWVRNLAAQPRTRYWTRGAPHDARATVIRGGARTRVPASLPVPMRRVARLLQRYTRMGWAFAILSPPEKEDPRCPSRASTTSRSPRRSRRR